MKITHRLWVSFCIIIILPIVMAFFALTAVSGLQNRNTNYWSEGLQFSNSIRMIYENTKEDHDIIEKWARTSPDIFLDDNEMGTFNDSLFTKSSCVVVRKEFTIIYDGSKDMFDLESIKLPGFGQLTPEDEARLFIKGETPLLFQQVDTVFSDNKRGSIFLITQANALLPAGRQMIMDVLLSAVIILTFTAIILIFWIYRGVFSQVNILVKAAENIKEGNLDFSLSAEGEDEMSELVKTFEGMRGRLQQDAIEKIEFENEQRQLISNIAHDLKTPLTAIRGYAEGILDGVADTSEKREAYLRTIDKKANEMNTLLNELTLYSKIDTNRIPYDFKRQNICAYFEDCIDELKVDMERYGIEIEYINKVDSEAEMIADPEQLMRVILNITGNSVKYRREEKGRIEFRILDVGDFVQIEIEDNGKGIEAGDLPYIFDRMYRGDVSRNSNIQGSGIGLSVAKKIIEDHGGQIWATSKAGIGTVMYFVLRKYEEADNGKNFDS